MNNLGPAACLANIDYYTNIEQTLLSDLLDAQSKKEYWELQLELQHEKNDNT